MFKQGIPLAAFKVEDIDAEAKRLKKNGVMFTMDPTSARACAARNFSRHLRQPDSDLSAAAP